MTPQQAGRVAHSLGRLAPRREAIAADFFARLYAREPALRLLFPGDPRPHAAALHSGLTAIVESLHRPHSIRDALEWLAARSARRGLGAHHYPAFAEAWLGAIETASGDGWTAELAQAWEAACRLVAGMMASALESEPLAA